MASANSNGRNGPWDDASYAQHGCCDVMIQWVELVGGDRFTARGVCVRVCFSVWARRKDMEEWIKTAKKKKEGGRSKPQGLMEWAELEGEAGDLKS